VGQTEKRQCLFGTLMDFALAPAHRTGGDPVHEDILARLVGASDHQVFERGHLAVLVTELERANNAAIVELVGRLAGDFGTVEPDTALGRLLCAGDHVEGRGLARAVGPDQANDGLRHDVETDPANRLDTPVGLDEVLYLQRRRCVHNSSCRPE